MENTKCWWRCGAIESLIQCWWECKLALTFWGTIWQCLLNLEKCTPCAPAILFLGVYQQKCVLRSTKRHTKMVKAALFIIIHNSHFTYWSAGPVTPLLSILLWLLNYFWESLCSSASLLIIISVTLKLLRVFHYHTYFPLGTLFCYCLLIFSRIHTFAGLLQVHGLKS